VIRTNGPPVQFRTGGLRRHRAAGYGRTVGTDGNGLQYPGIELPPPVAAEGSPPTAAPQAPDDAVERLRLKAALLDAEVEIRERRGAMQVARTELARTQHQLEAERERRTIDAERFRAGLAHVQHSAAEAVAAEQAARATAEAELEKLRAEVERLNRATAGFSRHLADTRESSSEARALAARLLDRVSHIERRLADGP
jgi:chromosome segregation ATPase